MFRLFLVVFLFVACKPDKETQVIERQTPPGRTPADDVVTNFPPPDGFPPVERDPTFLRFDNTEQFALAGVQSSDIDANERVNTRFVLLTDKFNEGTSPAVMDAYRAAVNKALNSLSTERDIVLAEGVDSTQTILRFDQRDLGWTSEDWRLIEAAEPFDIVSKTQRGALLRVLTQTRQPFIHAHNLIEAAMLNDTYYKIMDIPETLTQFYADREVNLQQVFDEVDEDLYLVGISRSQISIQKTRMFLRVDSRFGPMWSTYDTDLNNQRDNVIFEAPFPVEARSLKIFNHDAQEYIFELENGCHGYALYNAAGVRENFAPTTIVFNPDSGGLDPTIRNARVCLKCHNGGFIPKADEVNAKVQTDPDFNGADRERAAAFYGKLDTAEVFADDNERYNRNCLTQVGTSPEVREVVNELTDTFNNEWNLKQVASFLWLPEEEFARGLRASRAFNQIGQLLDGFTINKDDLIRALPDLEDDLNLFRDPLGQ